MMLRIMLWLAMLMVLPAAAGENFSATAVPDEHFSVLFNRCGPGITGGDSTYSTAAGEGRVLWLFSDSFIGRVGSEGRRNNDSSRFIQGNLLVMHDLGDDALTTYLGREVNGRVVTVALPGFPASPYSAHCPLQGYSVPAGLQAMFTPPSCPPGRHCYFWANAPVVEGEQLHVFLQRMEHAGEDAFGFRQLDTFIATLPLPALAVTRPSYRDVPDNGVSYGGAVMADVEVDGHRYTYIYGMRSEAKGNNTCAGHCLHVARVPAGSLGDLAQWRYWGQADAGAYGWVKDPRRSVPMAGAGGPDSAPMTQDQLGVASVQQCGQDLPRCHVIIAHQYTGGFTHTIQAWYAAQPQGPWHGPAFVYDTPESTQAGQLFTYNAKIHPEFTSEDGLLVSYDVNGLAPFDNPLSPFVTAASYRPRFIRVRLNWQQGQP